MADKRKNRDHEYYRKYRCDGNRLKQALQELTSSDEDAYGEYQPPLTNVTATLPSPPTSPGRRRDSSSDSPSPASSPEDSNYERVSSNDLLDSGDEFSGGNDGVHSDVSLGSVDNEGSVDNGGSGDNGGPGELDSGDGSSPSSHGSGDSDGGIRIDEPRDLCEDLARWATRHGCTQTSVNCLLEIFRSCGFNGRQAGLPKVPKDSRTLLKTPRWIETHVKCGGEYAYWGVEKGIVEILNRNPNFVRRYDVINLSVNIDGVPLFKSSNAQFWPILCKFYDFPPFVVALYCGNQKPTPLSDYVEDFIREINILRRNGLVLNDKTFTVTIKCFVCDAPARSYLKCIIGHAGYYACERCCSKGIRKLGGRNLGRTVYLGQIDGRPRTDARFQNQRYGHHQNGRSPLLDMGVLCVAMCVLDYMHLICLGVVKRILDFLLGDKHPRMYRLGPGLTRSLTRKLLALRGQLPADFVRQPRSPLEYPRWKATEFRQFLLYTGPVVLQDILGNEAYKHFMHLSVGIYMLLEEEDAKRRYYLPYARRFLKMFSNAAKRFYGNTFPVYNVHSVKHLADDVEYFDTSLNNISAFPFENQLKSIKKMVRKSKNPICQVGKRLAEKNAANPQTRDRHKCTQYISATRLQDSCFMLENGEYVFVRQIQQDNRLLCDVLRPQSLDNLFTSPCQSKLLNIGIARNYRTKFSRNTVLSKVDLVRKVVRLPYGDDGDDTSVVLLPLLHDMH
jgi:hypothetical protein